MSAELTEEFRRMGARVRVTRWAGDVEVAPARPIDTLSLDVRRDDAGEYFDLRCHAAVELRVADVRPDDRHLLLSARDAETPGADGTSSSSSSSQWSWAERGGGERSAFLCGRDERSWFVAAIPEAADARDVQGAKDALKPQAVWDAMREFRVPLRRRDARKTAAFVRQGEWFFIRRPRMKVAPWSVLRDEPIQRGAGRPHVCQLLARAGGQVVYVSFRYPNGLTESERAALPPEDRERTRWTRRVRDARVYVKGNVRHPDHKTVFLDGWHEVVQNTETEARAMRQLAFLD
jgi:hypothetical protein